MSEKIEELSDKKGGELTSQLLMPTGELGAVLISAFLLLVFLWAIDGFAKPWNSSALAITGVHLDVSTAHHAAPRTFD